MDIRHINRPRLSCRAREVGTKISILDQIWLCTNVHAIEEGAKIDSVTILDSSGRVGLYAACLPSHFRISWKLEDGDIEFGQVVGEL